MYVSQLFIFYYLFHLTIFNSTTTYQRIQSKVIQKLLKKLIKKKTKKRGCLLFSISLNRLPPVTNSATVFHTFNDPV